jgi:hypothetical protein
MTIFWVTFLSHFIIITFSDLLVMIQGHFLFMSEKGVSGIFWQKSYFYGIGK